ncbi:hypothetical protein WJX74_008711 [Apatococcus lobatus]|uniref:S-acyltransferase n=1 Tax=Apatococcus lobatus TaxID=904363 RepID=A0AAW1RIM9_9CHLO
MQSQKRSLLQQWPLLVFTVGNGGGTLMVYLLDTTLTSNFQGIWSSNPKLRWNAQLYTGTFMIIMGVLWWLWWSLYQSNPGYLKSPAAPGQRHCQYCGCMQPLRSKHDHRSGQCVAKFDHQCGLLNAPIGDLNHARFWLFAMLQTCIAAWGICVCWEATTCLLPFSTVPHRKACWQLHSGRTLLLLLFLLFLLAAVQGLFGLAVAHSYLACTGQTTYELLKGAQVPYLAPHFANYQGPQMLPHRARGVRMLMQQHFKGESKRYCIVHAAGRAPNCSDRPSTVYCSLEEASVTEAAWQETSDLASVCHRQRSFEASATLYYLGSESSQSEPCTQALHLEEPAVGSLLCVLCTNLQAVVADLAQRGQICQPQQTLENTRSQQPLQQVQQPSAFKKGQQEVAAKPPKDSATYDSPRTSRREKDTAVSEEEAKKRMAELEAKLIEEETALRVKQAIEKRVQEVMASDVVQQQLQQHLHTERQRLEKQVEEELRAERAQAEAEELRAKQAIEQKQQELQQIESAREQEEADIRRKAEQAEQSEAEKRLQELQERSKREQERRQQDEAKRKQEQAQVLGKGGARSRLSFKISAA